MTILPALTNNLPNHFKVLYTNIPGTGIAASTIATRNLMKEHGLKPLLKGATK
jgi:hypothetical protein